MTKEEDKYIQQSERLQRKEEEIAKLAREKADLEAQQKEVTGKLAKCTRMYNMVNLEYHEAKATNRRLLKALCQKRKFSQQALRSDSNKRSLSEAFSENVKISDDVSDEDCLAALNSVENGGQKTQSDEITFDQAMAVIENDEPLEKRQRTKPKF